MSIQYPIFTECSSYTLDEYWVDIFHSCSMGKFPDGITMHDDTTMLINDVRVNLDPDNPIDTYKKCIDVFKKLLDVERGDTKPNNSIEWSNLKSKSKRDYYITEYVLDLRTLYSLSRAETRHLGRIIRSACMLKIIKPEHIIFTDNRISDITNLLYGEEEFRVEGEIDVKLKKSANKKTSIVNKNTCKYIKSIKSD